MRNTTVSRIHRAFQKGYDVTRDGNVVFNGNPRRLYEHPKGRHPRKLLYHTFGVKLDGKTVAICVHQMQAVKKFGASAVEQSACVRHINGNSLDNSWDNIAIGSLTENRYDIPKSVRVRIASLANLKYDHESVREHFQQGGGYKSAMEKFGIRSKGTIYHILHK